MPFVSEIGTRGHVNSTQYLKLLQQIGKDEGREMGREICSQASQCCQTFVPWKGEQRLASVTFSCRHSGRFLLPWTRTRSENRMPQPGQFLMLVRTHSGENRHSPSPLTRAHRVAQKWVLPSARRRNRVDSRRQRSLIGGLVT